MAYTDNGEPLECPACGRQFGLGAVCVDCDLELVPAGSEDLSAPHPGASPFSKRLAGFFCKGE